MGSIVASGPWSVEIMSVIGNRLRGTLLVPMLDRAGDWVHVDVLLAALQVEVGCDHDHGEEKNNDKKFVAYVHSDNPPMRERSQCTRRATRRFDEQSVRAYRPSVIAATVPSA